MLRNRETRIVVIGTLPKVFKPRREIADRDEAIENTFGVMSNMGKPESRILRREGLHEVVVMDAKENLIASNSGDWGWGDHERRFLRRGVRGRRLGG